MNDLERTIQNALLHAEHVINFGQSLVARSQGSITPFPHQVVRIHESVKNKTKRTVLEDGTGAGKTLTAITVYNLLNESIQQEKGRRAKALVVAPNQALEEAWSQEKLDEYTFALGLPRISRALATPGNIETAFEQDMVLINYEKISRNDPESNRYVQAILRAAAHLDQVIVDEAHALKNPLSGRSQAFRHIIEATRDKHFMATTATPIPNRLEDAGFLLYMLDPEKFAYFADNPFDYAATPEAIFNARQSGAWFTFTREDVKRIFNLPPLVKGVPELGIAEHEPAEMSREFVDEYMAEWMERKPSIAKIARLSQILLQSEREKLVSMIGKITAHDPTAQFSVFSYYIQGREASFPEELTLDLQRAGLFAADEVSYIIGEVPLKDRLERARAFREGRLRVLVNSRSTVSESISLATGKRNQYIIAAEPFLTPASETQTIGRAYRKGAEAPVHVISLIPTSEELDAQQVAERDRLSSQGIRFRSSWIPGTLFANLVEVLEQKNRAITLVTQGHDLGELIAAANATEGDISEGLLRSLPSSEEVEQEQPNSNIAFNDGLKQVQGCVGRSVEALLEHPGKEAVVASYSHPEWDITSSGDTNRAIGQAIMSLEEAAQTPLNAILDWGSGPACLSRVLSQLPGKERRVVHNLDAMKELLAQGITVAREKELYGERAEEFFHEGNARDMTMFQNGQFDIVSSAYAIQYNAQGFEHKREVEEILAETNRVLRQGGFGILALPNQSSMPEAVEALTKDLLPRYGFKVLFNPKDPVTGHTRNEVSGRQNKVFQGSYIIIFQKEREEHELVGESDIFLFAPYKTLGVGGYKIQEHTTGCTGQAYKKSSLPADTFKVGGKQGLTTAIKKVFEGT
ncbi:MAG: DEAD/DEAH box helicase family protein [Candidatus Woesearchaeota archaeon]|nr:MAG: DEAD/DEAH box helicase family protein [Candidatus Woesearchaeota archaeon]